MSRANREQGGATLHTCLQVGTVIPRRSPTDSIMLQVSSLLLACIRQLVTTCSADNWNYCRLFPRPGLASGHHGIALRIVETCSGATVR